MEIDKLDLAVFLCYICLRNTGPSSGLFVLDTENLMFKRGQIIARTRTALWSVKAIQTAVGILLDDIIRL